MVKGGTGSCRPRGTLGGRAERAASGRCDPAQGPRSSVAQGEVSPGPGPITTVCRGKKNSQGFWGCQRCPSVLSSSSSRHGATMCTWPEPGPRPARHQPRTDPLQELGNRDHVVPTRSRMGTRPTAGDRRQQGGLRQSRPQPPPHCPQLRQQGCPHVATCTLVGMLQDQAPGCCAPQGALQQ